MHVGLIDVDQTKYPNLVLMKLSAYYKEQGFRVSLLSPDDVLLGGNIFDPADTIVGACVFSWNMPVVKMLREQGAMIGGIGTDDKRNLPPAIEHIYPDYSLYGIKDTAYGFLSRGCPRHCPFCVVGDKEGLISRKVADLSEFWSGQKYIVLCDPNILACEEWKNLMRQLIDSDAFIDINQGLDARLLVEEKIEMINALKVKMLHFAWDNPKDEAVPEKLLMFRKRTRLKDFRLMRVYVLSNYWSTEEQDLKRIYWLRDNGFDPYLMLYDKANASKRLRHMQRWVNNKFVFRTVKKFEEYLFEKEEE